uniref:Uncharacterized protein n=1 Tax=Nelumbo nucifera TaxID=4432 RepID=A0A822YAX9_NELNU|nr:TPA_asm: hypothetical protein HUJ06_029694 [Nelumbo nucifera]
MFISSPSNIITRSPIPRWTIRASSAAPGVDLKTLEAALAKVLASVPQVLSLPLQVCFSFLDFPASNTHSTSPSSTSTP